jgi:lactate dehydrogenase-like 2-hydroxyacid dehydrogenase
MPVEVLQLCPIIAAGDEDLHRRYKVCRWYEMADGQQWLEQHGPSIRAVVTGGHLGITDEMLRQLPSLGIIAIAGVGYERVNLEMARSRGIPVTNTPDVLTEDVADFAVGLLIATMRRIAAGDRYVRDGSWKLKEMELAAKVSGRRYGIVGLGRIGQAVARRLEGFGGSIAYTSRAKKDVPYTYYPSLLGLAGASEVLILTVAGGPATRNLVGREVLDALGPAAFLVNVARGSIVDETELIAALQEGRLAGAGLDVYADEPRVPEALTALPNVTLTPHIGSATIDARTAMARLMLANLDAFYAGQPLPSAVV